MDFRHRSRRFFCGDLMDLIYFQIPQWLLIGRTSLLKTILLEQEFLYFNLTTRGRLLEAWSALTVG